MQEASSGAKGRIRRMGKSLAGWGEDGPGGKEHLELGPATRGQRRGPYKERRQRDKAWGSGGCERSSLGSGRLVSPERKTPSSADTRAKGLEEAGAGGAAPGSMLNANGFSPQE